jgi:hypothetical protein
MSLLTIWIKGLLIDILLVKWYEFGLGFTFSSVGLDINFLWFAFIIHYHKDFYYSEQSEDMNYEIDYKYTIILNNKPIYKSKPYFVLDYITGEKHYF